MDSREVISAFNLIVANLAADMAEPIARAVETAGFVVDPRPVPSELLPSPRKLRFLGSLPLHTKQPKADIGFVAEPRPVPDHLGDTTGLAPGHIALNNGFDDIRP